MESCNVDSNGADRKQSGLLKNWRIDSIKREQQREREIG